MCNYSSLSLSVWNSIQTPECYQVKSTREANSWKKKDSTNLCKALGSLTVGFQGPDSRQDELLHWQLQPFEWSARRNIKQSRWKTKQKCRIHFFKRVLNLSGLISRCEAAALTLFLQDLPMFNGTSTLLPSSSFAQCGYLWWSACRNMPAKATLVGGLMAFPIFGFQSHGQGNTSPTVMAKRFKRQKALVAGSLTKWFNVHLSQLDASASKSIGHIAKIGTAALSMCKVPCSSGCFIVFHVFLKTKQMARAYELLLWHLNVVRCVCNQNQSSILHTTCLHMSSVKPVLGHVVCKEDRVMAPFEDIVKGQGGSRSTSDQRPTDFIWRMKWKRPRRWVWSGLVQVFLCIFPKKIRHTYIIFIIIYIYTYSIDI